MITTADGHQDGHDDTVGDGAAASPTGRQVRLAAGAYRAVVTEVGAGLRSLHHDGRALVDGFGEDELVTGGRGQVLVPWPNRVDGGRYEVDGVVRQLEITEPARGNATHGLTRWSAWDVAGERAADRVTWQHRLHPRPGYPHVLDLAVTYELDPQTGLTVTVTATNRGSSPAPWGFGAHPYLRAGTGDVDDWVLELGAETVVLTDERGIPTGTAHVADGPYDFRAGAPLAGRVVDHAFTGLARDRGGRATVRVLDRGAGTGVTLWLDASCGFAQVYTGDRLGPTPRAAVAVEPMSCAPNAYVTGDGLRWLATGEPVVHTYGITA